MDININVKTWVVGEQRSIYQEGALGLIQSPELQLPFCYCVTTYMSQIFYLQTPKSSLGRFKEKSNLKDYRQFNITWRPRELGLETGQLEHHPLSHGHSKQPGSVKIPTAEDQMPPFIAKSTGTKLLTIMAATVALRTSSCCIYQKSSNNYSVTPLCGSQLKPGNI